MPAFKIIPISNALPVKSSAFSSAIIAGQSTWQAAVITGDSSNTAINLDVLGKGNTAIPGAVSVAGTNPILNALQAVQVVAFLQPEVMANTNNGGIPAPLEYPNLPAGTYVLLHVHGAVNVNSAQPLYTGGWYSLMYDTNASTPLEAKVNYPELGRFSSGQAASAAYSGNSLKFTTTTAGSIILQFVNESGSYNNVSVTRDTNTVSAYIKSGISYPSAITSTTDPIAPLFALIQVDSTAGITTPTAYPAPALFIPSERLAANVIPAPYNNQIKIWTKHSGGAIYYTLTTDGSDPATPSSASTLYTGPITITGATKIKAIVYDSGLSSSIQYSPVSFVYYR